MDGVNQVTLGVVQFACSDDVAENLATATRLVRQAAAKGANIVVVQELFEGHYFCQEENPAHFVRAAPLDGHPTLVAMQALAAELGVVIPVSLFERRNQAYYNSVAMVDDTGAALGVYRKSHIPDGPGYSEKFYFNPGDTGFRVWPTRFGTIGVGICWDQWFPEAARAMALMGAEFLLYPTAIGSEPGRPDFDSMEHWRVTMRGHAGANLMPVAAANRIGTEIVNGRTQTYYGSSFIAGPQGELRASAGREGEAVLTATFDRAAMRSNRAAWGLFRDRRPELYGALGTADGGG
ncbi:MAG: N-carbamoylputrescine amidase [Mesorhizobium sp.]|nr:N-carbamoylputrescine amidase [Mesorhizobium sp.]